MAQKLTRLRIDEVASVDRGAGEGVKIMLMKREFSADERRRDAKSGAAMSDGSFPIENKSDLHNAMRLAGQAKDPTKAKAHIRARAAALGLTSELSDSYKKGSTMSIFNKIFGGLLNNQDNVEVIDKANSGLAESVASIMGDETSTPEQKAAALAKSFEQHGDYLKDTLTAGPAVVKSEESNMDLKVLAKALGLADTATEEDVAKALAKQNADIAALTKRNAHVTAIVKAEFSPEEAEFYDKAGKAKVGPDGEPDEDDKQKQFREASKADRAAMIKAAIPAEPQWVVDLRRDNEEMRKRLDAAEGGTALIALNKRAVEVGLPETEGATIQKALAGDKDAVNKLLDFVKRGWDAAKAAGVFKELGSSLQGTDATPYDQLMQKARDLYFKDPSIGTVEKAFAKVYEDPANRELAKQERATSRPAA